MVVDEVLQKIPDKNLAVHVVWTPVLGPDTYESALEARKYIPDRRARHYWDATQSLGLAYGRRVKLPNGRELAWDIYFAYRKGKEWNDDLPEPDDWVHQLGRDSRHLDDGAGLREAVEKLLEESRRGAAGMGAGILGRSDREKITVQVGGMMKSRSGAT